jgi:hypothetical protein
MSAFAALTFVLEGFAVTKHVRVRDRIHPDGRSYSVEEERAQTVKEISQRAKEAARDLAEKVYPHE